MNFLQVWLAGYYNPAKLVEGLRDKPAPQWGFYAQLLRAVLLSLLMYLPLYWQEQVPPLRSYLSFIPTGQYYGALIWLAPIVLFAVWLISGAVGHVMLRLLGRYSDVDQILNLLGMVALVVGSFLILWDWVWILVGGVDMYFLGISHLVIDLWGTVIMVVGLKRILEVPIGLGITLNLLMMAVSLPLAIMFMRSPL